jgi:multisubunit Na+/H+ antiporter MnhB subunit
MLIAVFLIVSILPFPTLLRPFGEPEYSDMDDYIISNAQNETGANNAVTSVVFDYRGFDTLGEATVLFTAVAGVLLVLRRSARE